MFYPQSHGPWWSAEFQARAIEGRRAVARSDNKLTWLDVQKALGREFPEEVEKHGLPSEQQVRNWAKDSPNLPEEMRKKGFLGGFEALEYKPEDIAYKAKTSMQPAAGSLNRAQMPVFPPSPSVALQPISAVQNWAVGFEALTGWLVFCIVLGM